MEGKTITQVAPLVGIARETYTKIELGINDNPSYNTIVKILDELGYALIPIKKDDLKGLL